MQATIVEIFGNIEDPRKECKCLHKLTDILFIALCALLSNGEDFEDMAEFGHQRREWLESFLELPNGIPSHDTFNRVLQLIDPEKLTLCLGVGASELINDVKGKLISFDGKKIRGVSPRSRGNKGLYILSAWVNENRICLGQKKVEDKSNEIRAIPELIDTLDLEGGIVSIDAIGCQVDIARKIIKAHADYILAVKANQGSLFDEVSDEYIWQNCKNYDETWEYDHGRYEIRRCQIASASEFLSPSVLSKWEEIKTIIRIDSQRTVKGVMTSQTRYYISSEEQTAASYNNAVRGHWGIENLLHWHLDVTFKEDASRARSGFAPQNLNILRKMALHQIRNMKDRLSLKKRRFRASMNLEYLEKVIFN